MMVGVLIGIFATLSYGLDAFRTQSNEIFVMNMLMKVSIRLHWSCYVFPAYFQCLGLVIVHSMTN